MTQVETKTPKPGVDVREMPVIAFSPGDAAKAVERALTEDHFFAHYRRSTRIYKKYAVASELIRDGRYKNPVRLLKYLIPDEDVIDATVQDPLRRIEARQAIEAHGQILTGRLTLLLIEKGHIDVNAKATKPEVASAQKQLERDHAENEMLMSLVSNGYPIDVVGQIALVDKFANITDAEKIEHLRAMTTRSLFGYYLGTLRGVSEYRELSAYDVYDMIPSEIFSNPEIIKRNIVPNYLEQEFMRRLTDLGVNEGMRELEERVHAMEDKAKRAWGLSIIDRFYDILTDPDVDKAFKSEIEVNGQKKNFPSFEQLAFVYDVLHNDTRLLAAQTGMGKTAAAFLAMVNVMKRWEKIDRKTHALIIAPANGKKTWIDEEIKLFEEAGDLEVVNGEKDLAGFYIRSVLQSMEVYDRDKLLEEVNKIFADGPLTDDDIKEALSEVDEDFRTDPEAARAKYALKTFIVFSQHFFRNSKKKPYIATLLLQAVKNAHIDGPVTLDEIDNLSNPKAMWTKVTLSVVDAIRQNFAQTFPDGEDSYVFGLTATPIKTGIKDLDVMMAMMFPSKFAPTMDTATPTRQTYSNTFLGDSSLVHLDIVGMKRMFRQEHATGVQDFEPEPLSLEASPFEEFLYMYVVDDISTSALEKFGYLGDTLLNPSLVKGPVRDYLRLEGRMPVVDVEKVKAQLKRTVVEWKSRMGVDAPQREDQYLNVDRLVELGMGDMVVDAFFSDEFRLAGFDQLVAQITKDTTDPDLLDLRNFWMDWEMSTKYKEIKRQIIEAIRPRLNEKGELVKSKVMVVAADRVRGITQEEKQKNVTNGNGNGDKIEHETQEDDASNGNGEAEIEQITEEEQFMYQDEELVKIQDETLITLIKQWIADEGLMDPNKVVMLDGSVPIEKRDPIVKMWKEDPDVVLVAGLQAMHQCVDLMVNATEDTSGVKIDDILEIYSGYPWYWQKLRQFAGRQRRLGQVHRVRSKVLEIVGLIDSGKRENVEFTYIIDRMSIAGIPPDTEERLALYESRLKGGNLPYQSKEGRFIRDALAIVAGAGEDKIESFGTSYGKKQEKNNYERLAERYYDGGNDRFTKPGYNAELVGQIFEELDISQEDPVLALGAGTLLFQRVIERGVDNVDINPHMMQVAWEEAGKYGGRMITARASNLLAEKVKEGSYAFVDAGFMLHWSKLGDRKRNDVRYSERVGILEQINQALRIRTADQAGGTLVLTLPERSFDDATFARFVDVLQRHFGFTVYQEKSGKTFATSKLTSRMRIGWCITAEKTGHTSLDGLNLSDLLFKQDIREWESKRKKGKTRPLYPVDMYGPSPAIRLQYDDYLIENPLLQRVVTAENEDVDKVDSMSEGVFADETLANDVIEGVESETSENGNGFSESDDLLDTQIQKLRGNSSQEHGEYGRLIRQIQEMLYLDRQKAEAFCRNILNQEADGDMSRSELVGIVQRAAGL